MTQENDDLNLINDSDSERVASRLSLLGKAAIDRFVIQLTDKTDNKSKAAALHVLGYLREDSAFDLIAEQVKSHDLTVAQAAVDSLKSFNDEKSVAIIKSLLTGPQPSLRRKALKTLNDLGASLDLITLDKLLKDKNWMVREELVYFIASAETDELEDLRKGLLADQHALVRKTAEKFL